MVKGEFFLIINPSNSKKPTFGAFLLEEYKTLSEKFLENENLGEKRVNFFITLATAILTVLFALTGDAILFLDVEVNSSLFLIGSIILLIFGIATLSRIIYRNIATDEMKRQLDTIRSFFVEEYNDEVNFLPFNPFKKVARRKNPKYHSLGRGGLLQMVALMNSLLGALIIYWMVGCSISEYNFKIHIHLHLFLSGCAFILTWLTQIYYTRRKYNEKLGKEVKEEYKSSVWEWRVFFPSKDFKIWKNQKKHDSCFESLKNCSFIDEKLDFYYNVQSPEIGLKERRNLKDQLNKDLLNFELKVLLKKKDNGIEFWKKFDSTTIQIQEKEAQRHNECVIVSYLHRIRKTIQPKYRSKIESVISSFCSYKPKILQVKKVRKQIRGEYDPKTKIWNLFPKNERKCHPLENPNVVLVEQTLIEIFSSRNQNNGKICTICVEALNPRIINKFLKTYMNEYVFEKKLARSYPEYLQEYFSKI
jgi:hypothetical protein